MGFCGFVYKRVCFPYSMALCESLARIDRFLGALVRDTHGFNGNDTIEIGGVACSFVFPVWISKIHNGFDTFLQEADEKLLFFDESCTKCFLKVHYTQESNKDTSIFQCISSASSISKLKTKGEVDGKIVLVFDKIDRSHFHFRYSIANIIKFIHVS